MFPAIDPRRIVTALALLVAMMPAALAIPSSWGPVRPMCISGTPGSGNCMSAIHGVLVYDGSPMGKLVLIDFQTSGALSTPPCVNCSDIVLFDPVDPPDGIPYNYPIVSLSNHPDDLGPNGHEFYCGGHAAMSTGLIAIRGGEHNGPGNRMLSFFDPLTNTFTRGPDEQWTFPYYARTIDQPTKRWYPTFTALGTAGGFLCMDGTNTSNVNDGDNPADPDRLFPDGNPNVPVRLELSGSTWSWNPLLSAEYCKPDVLDDPNTPGTPEYEWCNGTVQAPRVFNTQTYPYMFLMSSGKVLYCGSQYNRLSDATSFVPKLLDPAMEEWVDWPGLPPGTPADSLPIKGGAAVMFGKDKILISGGSNSELSQCNADMLTTNRTFLMDFSAATPQRREVGGMNRSRMNHSLVSLPDGTVLALGGGRGYTPEDPPPPPPWEVCHPDNAVLQAEIFDPVSELWSEEPVLMGAPRVHHWVALLLADGSVFTAGGQSLNQPDPDGPGGPLLPPQYVQQSFQIFYPSYFQFSRPVIVPSSIPSLMQYGRAYNISLQVAEQITKVRLIRPGAVTHLFDQDARMMELEFTQVSLPGGGGFSAVVRVRAPQHADLAPPGYYMLFLCTGANGSIPSAKGEFVKIGP